LSASEPTVGARLRRFLEGGNRSQKEVALAWHEQWSKRTQHDLISVETAISRLSGILNDKSEGIRFFFNDPARAILLFEILQISSSEHTALSEQGRAAMENGGIRPARLVVDLSTLGSDLDPIDLAFLFVEREVMTQPIRPVAMILTPDQYRYLPRTFDDFGADLQVERTDDPKTAWEKVLERAGEHALVLSARRFPVFHRWIAARFSPRRAPVVLDPPDALRRLGAEGSLPLLAQVTHAIEELGVAPRQYVPAGTYSVSMPAAHGRIPEDPVELRRLIAALSDETRASALGYPPEHRLWLSQQLGVPATSTAAERMAHDIRAAAVEQELEIRDVDPAELDRIVARAHRRLLEPTALRTGETLHLINPSKPVSDRRHATIHVHRIESRLPPLVRLHQAVQAWTEGDWLADPFMEQVIAQLDPQGQERDAFAHARATLVFAGVLEPQPAPRRRDWRQALAALLRGAPPAARLRLAARPDRGQLRPVHGDAASDNRWTAARLLQVHAVGDVTISRDERWEIVQPLELGTARRRYDGGFYDYGIFLCIVPGQLANVDLWLDLIDASPAMGGKIATLGDRHRDVPLKALSEPSQKPDTRLLELPDDLWLTADRELALAWWAMREALESAPDYTMHDGTGMLALGHAGVFAEVLVFECQPREDDRVDASLYLPPMGDRGWEANSLVEPVTSLVIGSRATEAGYLLPREIHLRGPSTFATIRFCSSPLFGKASGHTASAPGPGAIAAALAEHVRQEEQARAEHMRQQEQALAEHVRQEEQAWDDDDDD
jgi:hypothetical protein